MTDLPIKLAVSKFLCFCMRYPEPHKILPKYFQAHGKYSMYKQCPYTNSFREITASETVRIVVLESRTPGQLVLYPHQILSKTEKSIGAIKRTKFSLKIL